MRLHCDTLSTMNFFSRLVKLRLQIGSNRVFLHGLVLTHKIHKNGFYVIVTQFRIRQQSHPLLFRLHALPGIHQSYQLCTLR